MSPLIRIILIVVLIAGTSVATFNTVTILHNKQVIRNEIAIKQRQAESTQITVKDASVTSSNESVTSVQKIVQNFKVNTPVPSGTVKSTKTTLVQVDSPYTLSKVSLHNSTQNCWLVISDKIYNLTSFLNQHPGGVGSITPYCGKDGTTAFKTHGHTGGSNHSAYAYSLLPSYFVANVSSGVSTLVTSANSQVTSSTLSQVQTSFGLGARVYVSSVAPLNTRSTANGTSLGKQDPNAVGTIISGPIVAGGYTWWNVNFDTGVDGWVAQNFIKTGTSIDNSLPANTQTIALPIVPITQSTYTLSVTKTGSGQGVVSGTAINCGSVCSSVYTAGTSVTLIATPSTGYVFTGWTGACTGTGSCVVTLSSNKSVTAIFDNSALITAMYSLTVSSSGGTVTSNPSGISCGSQCSTSVAQGTTITLTATPSSGYTFSGWSGACSGNGSCSVTLSSNKSVSASFTQAQIILPTVTGGYTASDVSSHNSQGNCWLIISGKVYNVTNFISSHPGGASAIISQCGTDATTLFTTSAGHVHSAYAQSLLPTYYVGDLTVAPSTYTLSVSKSGTGTGTVSGGTISCGTTCSSTVAVGATITLSASPTDTKSVFTGWTGACSGTGTCVVTLSSNKSVGAIFDLAGTQTLTYTLSATKTGTGSGTVSSSAGNINCGVTCSTTVTSGTSATFTATAQSGSTFTGWSGACSGTGTCTVTVNANTSVTATFAIIPTFSLTVTSTGGTVTSNPSGISCVSSNCSSTFNQGTSVTLSMTPTVGYTFSGWSGACTGTGTCTVTMNSNQSVTANYTSTGVVTTYTATQVATHSTQGNCWLIISGKVYNVTNFISSHPGGVTAIASRCGTDATTVFTTNGGGGHAHSATAYSLLPTYYVGDLTVAPSTYTLSVSKSGTGTGTVSGGTISCGATCSSTVNAGTSVTLTATPTTGSNFTGWTGACSGTGTCTVTLNSNQSVGALFDLAGTVTTTFTLSVTSANGTVSSNPAGISCGATCSSTFTQGTSVTLTATPATGYTFSGWSGACSGTGTCTVTMSADQSVAATYTAVVVTGPTTYTVNVDNTGTYDVTNLTLNVGDKITFRYSSPRTNEVKTAFTPSTITTITLDSENTSRTRTFNTAGTWTFKAQNYNGNQGTIVVQ